MRPKIFDRLCIFLLNPWVWALSILSIMFIFKFFGCVALLILFHLIKRANAQNP